MISLGDLLAILQSNKALSIYLHHIIDIIDINDSTDIFLFVCYVSTSSPFFYTLAPPTISFPREHIVLMSLLINNSILNQIRDVQGCHRLTTFMICTNHVSLPICICHILNRFLGKPERGQQCIINLFWLFFQKVNTTCGVERHQRGVESHQRGVKPPTPRQIEHCVIHSVYSVIKLSLNHYIIF